MLSFCASSKHRQTRRFLDTLQAYLADMRTILRQTQRRKTFTGTRARSSERLNGLPQNQTQRSGRALNTLAVVTKDEGDDLELTGGYGYFDVGTMENLLRAQSELPADPHQARIKQKRAAIGRRLRLNEY